VSLFEQYHCAGQWEYTFDNLPSAISDLVHDRAGRICEDNQRLSQLLGREGAATSGSLRNSSEQSAAYKTLPLIDEGSGRRGRRADPCGPAFPRFQLYIKIQPAQLGTVHVPEDIPIESAPEGEKIPHAVYSVQEGCVYLPLRQDAYGFSTMRCCE